MTSAGNVLVNGYTDNQPIRTRAVPVQLAALAGARRGGGEGAWPRMNDPDRAVRAAGKGDADPIASNTTADGRQQNRRTEIVLLQDVERCHEDLVSCTLVRSRWLRTLRRRAAARR